MKNTFLAIGVCIVGTVFAQQNQPDSLHVVLRENQNGIVRTLDTIVPLSQQQSLFLWMEANGWDAPPPPPPVPGQPMMFEHEIVIDGDSGFSPEGNQRVMIIHMDGDSGMMPPMPPMPPGQCRKVVMMDGAQMSAPGEGDVVFMRHPMPPNPPCGVLVEITEKDTVINGETHKMIIRTERMILPLEPPAPPLPPNAPVPPTPPADGKTTAPVNGKRDLVVYPNPTSEIISVEFDVAAKEKTTLRIIDMNGKIIYNEEIIDEHGKHIYREINLSGKGKGTYTVEVKSAKKVIAETIILQ